MMRSPTGVLAVKSVYILSELDAISEKIEVMDGKCRKKAKEEDQQT
jgi:hypothetical protein